MQIEAGYRFENYGVNSETKPWGIYTKMTWNYLQWTY